MTTETLMTSIPRAAPSPRHDLSETERIQLASLTTLARRLGGVGISCSHRNPTAEFKLLEAEGVHSCSVDVKLVFEVLRGEITLHVHASSGAIGDPMCSKGCMVTGHSTVKLNGSSLCIDDVSATRVDAALRGLRSSVSWTVQLLRA